MTTITVERRAAMQARVARTTQRISSVTTEPTTDNVESALDAVDRRTMVEVYRLASQAIRAIPGSTIDPSDVAHNVILDIADGKKDGAKTLRLMRDGSSEGYCRMRVLLAQRLISDAKRDGMYSRSAELVRWAIATESDQRLAKTHRQAVTVEDGPRRMSHGPLAHRDAAERELVSAALEASKDYSALGVIAGGTNPNRPDDVRQVAEQSETIWQGHGGPRSDRDDAAAFLRDNGVMVKNVRETTITRRMEVSNLAAKGRTQIVKGVTRMDRGASLEDMLTSLEEMKVHHVFDPSETDYYLVGPLGHRLADKWEIAQFRSVFPSVLNRTAAEWSGRGKSQIADALARLSTRDADYWRRAALMARNVEMVESPNVEPLPSTATKEQKQAATAAAKATTAKATRASNMAQLTHHLAILSTTRQVTLSDVVLAAVIPVWEDGQERADAHRSSALDARSVCDVLGLPAQSNGEKGLSLLIRDAAETALSVPVPLSDAAGEYAYRREIRALDRPSSTMSEWMRQNGRTVRTFGIIRSRGPVDHLPSPVETPEWLREVRQSSTMTPTTPAFGLPGRLPKVGAAPELPAMVVTGDQTPTPRSVLRERLDVLFARPLERVVPGRWVH